jgi:hypothetical protein
VNLDREILEVQPSLDPPGPSIYVSRDGLQLALIGAHVPYGWCWCQPTVVRMLEGNGEIITHRRTSDLEDE